MNVQYISDNSGTMIGVFIPLHDWNNLKKKYKEIGLEEREPFDGRPLHKKLVRQRLISARDIPENRLDWDNVQKEIEGEYGF